MAFKINTQLQCNFCWNTQWPLVPKPNIYVLVYLLLNLPAVLEIADMFPSRNIFQPGFQGTLYIRFSTYLIDYSFFKSFTSCSSFVWSLNILGPQDSVLSSFYSIHSLFLEDLNYTHGFKYHLFTVDSWTMSLAPTSLPELRAHYHQVLPWRLYFND